MQKKKKKNLKGGGGEEEEERDADEGDLLLLHQPSLLVRLAHSGLFPLSLLNLSFPFNF